MSFSEEVTIALQSEGRMENWVGCGGECSRQRKDNVSRGPYLVQGTEGTRGGWKVDWAKG